MTKLAENGAPFICTSEVVSQNPETEFDVYGAYIPTCPFQGS